MWMVQDHVCGCYPTRSKNNPVCQLNPKTFLLNRTSQGHPVHCKDSRASPIRARLPFLQAQCMSTWDPIAAAAKLLQHCSCILADSIPTYEQQATVDCLLHHKPQAACCTLNHLHCTLKLGSICVRKLALGNFLHTPRVTVPHSVSTTNSCYLLLTGQLHQADDEEWVICIP